MNLTKLFVSLSRIHKATISNALGLTAICLGAGLALPASAQSQIQCQTNTSVPPAVRVEGYAEPMGDMVLACTGGVPTAAGQTVPTVSVTVFLTTNITSKLLGYGGLFSEALLIVDDPYTPGPNFSRPILNCGAPGAPDSGPSGPGICATVSTGDPAHTYDGTPSVRNTTACSKVFGCGRPNVFQGRRAFNNGLSNAIEFSHVPFDPPGTSTSRTLRITNVRADAEFVGVSATFFASAITMHMAVNGGPVMTIHNPDQVVGYVEKSLVVSVNSPRLDFTRCNTENGKLFAGVPFSFIPASNCSAATCGGASGGGNNSGSGSPVVHFAEGFGTAWKPRNISEVLANGMVIGGQYIYAGSIVNPSDQNQNVAGTVNYNTETEFSYASTAATPVPNPPIGIGNGPVSPTANLQAFADASGTGIAGAGIASQGTRLALEFANIQQGARIYVPPVIYLYRQGTPQAGGPTTFVPSSLSGPGTPVGSSGVMVLTATDDDGDGDFKPPSSVTNLHQVPVHGGRGLAVYEIVFADIYSLEAADVPVVVAWDSTNGSAGGGQTATVTAGFAPFHNSFFDRLPSGRLSIPRFVEGKSPMNLFKIGSCAGSHSHEEHHDSECGDEH